MNRFDTYTPIKFDVPMFTPDFAALEALQTQKQKTLDDFRNQTDLIASSIKDDPFDPTVKEKKIKDIMASKDAIVNEMLRNPSKGNALLGQFQNTLKNDILFGDINKVNARATDYESKIADLKTQPLWNDPIWRKGALEQIKNSYGDFQTAEGFGKTKGDDFAHTFYTVPERDAILNSYVDKVAHEQYDGLLIEHPELASNLSFDTYKSQMKTDELSYKRLLEAALPQALADTRLQDFYETEGKLRGLGEGQGQVKLKRNADGSLSMDNGHPVVDDSNLFGQALHGTLNERTYKSTSTNYIKGSNDRLQMNLNQQFQAQQQEDSQAYQSNENKLAREFQAQQAAIARKAAEEADIRKMAIAIAEADKKTGVYNQGLTSIPIKGEANMINATVLNKQILDIDKQLLNPSLDNLTRKALLSQKESLNKQFDDFMKGSPNANKIMRSSEVQNADWQGSNFTSTMWNMVKETNAKAYSPNSDASWYGRIGYGLLGSLGATAAASTSLLTGLVDAVTHVVNANDYSPQEIEKGTLTQKPIVGYSEQLTKSVLKNESWDEFLKTPVGQTLKSQGSYESTGILNSAKKQYDAAKEYVESGQAKLDIAQIPVESMIPFPSQKEGDFGDSFKKDIVNGVTYNSFSYNKLPLREYIASINNTTPDNIVFDEKTINANALAGDMAHLALNADYSVIDEKGKKHSKNFTGKVEANNAAGYSVLNSAQGQIMNSAFSGNSNILNAVAQSSVGKNMEADVLKLESIPPSTADEKGYVPTNTSDPTFYATSGISVKKVKVGDNYEYIGLIDGKQIGKPALSSTDILQQLETLRLQTRHEGNIKTLTPEEKTKQYMDKARAFYSASQLK